MHSISFDNSFSSYQLLHDLTIQGFRAIWTMRNYRIIKCVKENDLIKKEKKGSFDYQSCGFIEIATWNDNLVITLEIYAYAVDPVRTLKR